MTGRGQPHQGGGRDDRDELGARGLSTLELWHVDLGAAGAALREVERATPRLSAWDRDNAAALADAGTAEQWMAAHIALRVLLERAAGPDYRGVPLERQPHAKPKLMGAPVAFSLSHTGAHALIGIAPEDPVGVDLENERPVHMRAPRRKLIEAAAVGLAAGAGLRGPDGSDARFLQAWVRLEAVAKALGCGIGPLLTQLGVTAASGASEANVTARARDLAAQVLVADLGLGRDLFAAVALSPRWRVPQVRPMPTDAAALAELLR